MNPIRGHAGKFGLVAAKGPASSRRRLEHSCRSPLA
jgi:hypothetical protein